jgi:hypothetical protein
MDDRDLFIHTQYGKFEYDADFDVYRKCIDRPITHRERYGWIYITVVLALIAYFVTEFR